MTIMGFMNHRGRMRRHAIANALIDVVNRWEADGQVSAHDSRVVTRHLSQFSTVSEPPVFRTTPTHRVPISHA